MLEGASSALASLCRTIGLRKKKLIVERGGSMVGC